MDDWLGPHGDLDHGQLGVSIEKMGTRRIIIVSCPSYWLQTKVAKAFHVLTRRRLRLVEWDRSLDLSARRR